MKEGKTALMSLPRKKKNGEIEDIENKEAKRL